MTQIMVDAATRTKLYGLAQPAELLDEDGQVLGRFLPAVNLAQYEPLKPQVSEEELQKRARRAADDFWPISSLIWRNGHELYRHLGARCRTRPGWEWAGAGNDDFAER